MVLYATPARVVAVGTNTRATLAFEKVAPLEAARTSQRLQVNTYSHPTFNQLSNPFSGFMSFGCLPPGFGFCLLPPAFPLSRPRICGDCGIGCAVSSACDNPLPQLRGSRTPRCNLPTLAN